jgi:hypothetical protein
MSIAVKKITTQVSILTDIELYIPEGFEYSHFAEPKEGEYYLQSEGGTYKDFESKATLCPGKHRCVKNVFYGLKRPILVKKWTWPKELSDSVKEIRRDFYGNWWANTTAGFAGMQYLLKMGDAPSPYPWFNEPGVDCISRL